MASAAGEGRSSRTKGFILMGNPALDYLGQHELLVLATASKSGVPHAAPMFYATEDNKIYFSAPDGSTTANNLRENALATIAIADVPANWGQAKGLQIKGTVHELDDTADEAEETHAAELFGARYPHLGDAVKHTHYWRLDPTAIQFTDNSTAGDESAQSLGQSWERKHINP